MYNKYRIEVNIDNGGWEYTAKASYILDVVESLYTEKERYNVDRWMDNVDENSDYVSKDGTMHIYRLRSDNVGLDISIRAVEEVKCPNCDEVVFYNPVETVESYGRDWYSFLEKIKYKTSDNQCRYGEDMLLTDSQVNYLFDYLDSHSKRNCIYNSEQICSLISMADRKKYKIVVNADW